MQRYRESVGLSQLLLRFQLKFTHRSTEKAENMFPDCRHWEPTLVWTESKHSWI